MVVGKYVIHIAHMIYLNASFLIQKKSLTASFPCGCVANQLKTRYTYDVINKYC